MSLRFVFFVRLILGAGRVGAVFELCEQRLCRFIARIEFEEPLQDFACFAGLSEGRQAAGQASACIEKVPVMFLIGRKPAGKSGRHCLEAILEGEAEMPACDGNVPFFQGNHRQQIVRFDESLAVGHQIQQLIAGDVELISLDHGMDFLDVLGAIAGAFRGHEHKVAAVQPAQAQAGRRAPERTRRPAAALRTGRFSTVPSWFFSWSMPHT